MKVEYGALSSPNDKEENLNCLEFQASMLIMKGCIKPIVTDVSSTSSFRVKNTYPNLLFMV